MPQDLLDLVLQMPAAEHWVTGTPTEPGRYLIEYEEYGQRRVFVADWTGTQWSGLGEAEVLRFAQINSEYA